MTSAFERHQPSTPAELYTKVYATLDRHQINEAKIDRDYSTGRIDGRPDGFLASLTELFATDVRHWDGTFNSGRLSDTGPTFILRHPATNTMASIDGRFTSHVAIKKSLILSSNWLSLFPGHLDWAIYHEENHRHVYVYNPDFLRALVRYRHLALKEGLGFVLPEHSEYQLVREIDGHVDRNDFGRLSTLHPLERPSNTYTVDLEKERIRRLFAEQGEPFFAVDLLLPRVSSISMDTLLRVRHDESEHLVRFQRAINDFLRHSSETDSERVMVDLLSMIDSEVRELNSRFERLRKMRTLQGITLAASMVGITICFFAPVEVVKYLAALVGAQRSSSILEYVLERKSFYSELEEGPFFLPWKLSRLSQ